jgi:hypothetical protein
VLKILYASEDEKVVIDDNGNLTITPLEGGAAGADEDMLNEENKDDE